MLEIGAKVMIFVVTNRNLVKQGTVFEAVERAARNGANAVILREKDLDSEALKVMGQKMKVITDRYSVPLIVNKNIEVAKEINAYGVQLSFSELSKMQEIGSLNFGVSIHSLEEAIEAQKQGAKYILAGNIFETDCKPGLKGRGLDFIIELSNNISIPIVAIGGISTSNIKEVMNSGAGGAAVMSSAMCDYDESFIRKLKKIISNFQ